MELHAVVVARLVGHGDDCDAGGGRHCGEAGGYCGNAIAVRHPDIQHAARVGRRGHRVRRQRGALGRRIWNLTRRPVLVVQRIEQPARSGQPDRGVAELAGMTALDAATQLRGHGLHAVADAEDRHAQIEHGIGHSRRTRLGHRLGSAGQDHAFRGITRDVSRVMVPGPDFAIHADLAHAAGDQLRVLRAEVEDQDLVAADVRRHRDSGLWDSRTRDPCPAARASPSACHALSGVAAADLTSAESRVPAVPQSSR